MTGISNFTIEKVVNEIDDDLKSNFVGVFPSNNIFKCLNFANLVKEKHIPYPFMIIQIGLAKKERIGGAF